ncbi:hypothetical protein QFW80_04715 [Luteimonas sp. M1R5S18]|uniref:Uncharacterized protein n=1 Tax=Luteimonas rhizosphaericola TaxID=3042024 RepID=A0ABT6JGN9_9GAMM|nr:hypothetical protein [Luteimonas rhizosphaericola]MDH5829819.1 hypothetical protein [Luteimonas rhizosphaericola]
MEESLPIWPQHEVFYIESMLFHTRQACSSIEYVCELIKKIDSEMEAGKTPEFDCSMALDNLQRMVLAAGALSRYFWPVRKAHQARGDFLKRALRINDDSPLRARVLRDASEHFDERLDKHLSGGIVGVIMPEWFGPSYKGKVEAHFFRAYFIDSGVFKILGEEFEVQSLSDELVRLHNRLVFLVENGGRLPEAGA